MSSPVEPTDPITELGEVLATAERHVQEIVAAAEHRATERLRDAQAQLDARAAELNAIADELLTASAVVHHQLQRLRSLVPLEDLASDQPTAAAAGPPSGLSEPSAPVAALRSAESARPQAPVVDQRSDVGAPSGSAATAVTAAAGPVPAHDHDLPIIGGGGHAPAAPADQLDSARLVALSMAASGRSRGEVEAHLRNELGISDYGPLIDYVFGISTPASVVPSWPPRRRRRND